ncbi:MAG: hypothetical protein V9G24_21075 [Rhodoblastus sp.]
MASGEFAYMADAASFRFCRSDRPVPVAMEGAYKALEEAYRAQRSAPGAPLFVTIEGDMALKAGMEGAPRRTLTVSRFIAAWPGETCERNKANAALKETYWKIVTLNGAAVQVEQNTREPNIVFRGEGPIRRDSRLQPDDGRLRSEGPRDHDQPGRVHHDGLPAAARRARARADAGAGGDARPCDRRAGARSL